MQDKRPVGTLDSDDPAVVVITSSFPKTGDGSEAAGSFVLDLVEEIARYGPCRVVAPGRSTAVEKLGRNLEIFRFTSPEKPLSTLNLWSPPDAYQALQVMRSGRAASAAAMDAGPARLVVALWALPSGYWARQVTTGTRVPYAVWALGSDIWSLGRIPIVRSAIRRVLRGAETVYSDGIMLAEQTRELSGKKVGFLPSTRRISPAYRSSPRERGPYRFTFIGRWHPNKGIDLLLSALDLLVDRDWAWIEAVSIYGGGQLEPEVRAWAQRLSDSGRPVILGGYLSKRQAQSALRDTDWLLIPSRIESIPLIYSDALKLSVPVLANPVGDLKYLVREDMSGELADSVSARALAALIRKGLSRSPAMYCDALSKAAKRFDLHRIVKRLTNVSVSGHA